MEVQTRLRLRELKEGDWDLLITRILDGECTPFLGAGASAGTLPLARDIANAWAERYDYPLPDKANLIQVAQFLVVDQMDAEFPKQLIQQGFKKIKPPDFDSSGEVHGILADLPISIYITTNYDDFMVRALENRGKQPITQLCRWWSEDVEKKLQEKAQHNEALRQHLSVIFKEEVNYSPTAERPIVYYMHGNINVLPSMVLTEDDYLDFLIKMGDDKNLLPSRIVRAFTENSLLFLGYSLSDANFRVVFRSLASYMKRSFGRAHVSVQIAPDGVPEQQLEKVLRYLDSYFKELKIHVYWGTCQEFTADLRKKMGKGL